MSSKIFKKRIGSEFLSKYFPAQSSVCNTTHFPLNEPSQQNQNIYFFLGSIPKSWDFCCMAQENAALGRLRPYRLRDCRVFGNMIHLPALWVLSNLLTSSICCSCSVTISRAGAWFHIPTPCTCTRASLEGKCRCVCSFPVFEKKTFFLQKKITAESIYHVYLLPSITSTEKRFRFRLLHCGKLWRFPFQLISQICLHWASRATTSSIYISQNMGKVSLPPNWEQAHPKWNPYSFEL